MLKFPNNFVWGAASSAYQVEGAVHEDGRGESIWDRFAHTPEKTYNGDTGDVACDHYHRYAADVDLIGGLGLQAYRFSIAWPRILPQGRGKVNPAGLDFYDRLTDALLAADVTPYAFLYHWDLPQALEDQDGWLNRDITDAFAEYTDVVSRHLGDRVKHWGTFNEPLCVSLLGYYYGAHAPGHRDDTFREANTALHHVCVAHGKAVPILRANIPDARVGVAINLYPIYPATQAPEDIAAAKRFDRFHNDWFSLPMLKGEYPADLVEMFGPSAPPVQDGDMQMICPALDYVGLNYYSRLVAAHDPESNDPLQVKIVHVPSAQYTVMDWEIYEDGLYDVLKKMQNEYTPIDIMITENGCAMPDEVSADGKVHDAGRVDYLHKHIAALHRAIQDGVPVAGYFVWSLMDNFEWAQGYSKRFGIVYVDYETQARIPKDSYAFYRNVIKQNGVQ